VSQYPKALLLIAGALLAAGQPADSRRYIEDVKQLAAPEMQGRGAGTKGIERAARFIEARFKALGLQPAGERGSFRQTFRVTTGAKPGPDNRLEVTGGRRLRMNTDFTPLSFSKQGEASGPVVFASFGITAPEFQHDDYKDLDVKGKVVLVQRYEPRHFRKDERAWTHHASLVSKAINARNRGAAAILLMNGDAGPEKGDELIQFGGVAGPEDVGIPMLQVKNAVGDEWRKMSNVSVKLRVDIERRQAEVHNVIGFLPGRGEEYVIVGAHYDHLGFGDGNSLAPSQIGQVHHGADDNASGTAGLLELARLLSAKRGDLERGVLFMAFAGEEIGLLGSSHWTKTPTKPLEHAVAMINLDMIGRMNGTKLFVGGTGTGSTFERLLKEAGGRYALDLQTSADAPPASDHTSFQAKSIPVLFFFSGLHGDYHKPSDTWDKIDPKSSSQVVRLVYDVTARLASGEERPKFTAVAANPHAGGSVPAGGGYGPYFGSIPDFAPVPNGVKFSDVRPGSPAGKAGLKAGDILIAFGDKPITNLYDFTYALRASKVGDVVTVKFLRDGREMSAQVTLEARR
jgi:hypothetical protein